MYIIYVHIHMYSEHTYKHEIIRVYFIDCTYTNLSRPVEMYLAIAQSPMIVFDPPAFSEAEASIQPTLPSNYT